MLIGNVRIFSYSLGFFEKLSSEDSLGTWEKGYELNILRNWLKLGHLGGERNPLHLLLC